MICYLFDVTEDHEHFIGRVEIPYCCFGLGTESIFVNLLSMVVNPGCYNDVLKSSAPICELGPYERERFDDQLPPKSSILEIRVNGKLLQFKNYGWAKTALLGPVDVTDNCTVFYCDKILHARIGVKVSLNPFL
jgi:hypothetical protein